MENSLFTQPTQQPQNVVPPPQNNGSEEVLQALLSSNISTDIRQDTSLGKINSLRKFVPKTRGLKRIIRDMNEDLQKISVRSADEAVDMLEVMLDIVNGAFVIQDRASTPAEPIV